MNEPTYEAPNGVWYDSPEQYMFLDILGGCGCGLSDEIAERAFQVLNYFSMDHKDRTNSLFSDDNDEALSNEILAHWLDSKELIEHGSSIYGSWLTKKGEDLLNTLKSVKED
jgi:hypothetical protein